MPGSHIEVQTPDGEANAYLSVPPDAPAPGVLFIMDAFGLRPRIEQMADRIAQRGYTVLAPNVFYRAGRSPVPDSPDLSTPEARTAFFAELQPLMGALTPEAVAHDGRAYFGKLAELAPGPVGITGYCMGVRLAIVAACSAPERVAALAGFHGGRLVTDDPASPHRLVGSLQGELYFGHADNDASMTPENIAELERALDAAGVAYRSELYAGAAHGYTMSDTAAYDDAACERHFRELFSLLERRLQAAEPD